SAAPHPSASLLPYTTLFRSWNSWEWTYRRRPRANSVRMSETSWEPSFICRIRVRSERRVASDRVAEKSRSRMAAMSSSKAADCSRSEEDTSELQSRFDLVCRLRLETTKV